MEKTDLCMETKLVDTRVLQARAEQYCARAERCASEVEVLMKKCGATVGQTNEVIEHLQEHGFVNDARYCRAFVHDKVAFDGWGKRKIQHALRARHLPDYDIEAALQNIDETAYKTNILTLIKRHSATAPDKQLLFMLQRGYTYEDIRRYTKIEIEEDAPCE